MAADLLSTIRAEIDARMRELGPLLAEYEELLSASDALAAQSRAVSAPTPRSVSSARPARGRGRPRRAPAASAADTAGVQLPWRPTRARGRTGRGPSIGPAGQAVLAALEHGSHTVAELVVVTALPAPDIRHDLRPLLKLKAIVKTERDGKTAYALPAPVAA